MITGILLILPLLFSLVIFSLKNEKWIHLLAIGGSVIEFLVSLYGLFLYSTQCSCQFLLNIDWIYSIHVPLRFDIAYRCCAVLAELCVGLSLFLDHAARNVLEERCFLTRCTRVGQGRGPMNKYDALSAQARELT